jgi:hypothetical protein
MHYIGLNKDDDNDDDDDNKPIPESEKVVEKHHDF